MYRSLALVCMLLAAICRLSAQAGDSTASARVDTTWNHTLVAGLNLTQVGYTDWAQGGDNALAYEFTLDGKSTANYSKTNWETIYKFAFGQTRLGSQGLRKTDDKIDIASTLTYKLGTFINPYAGVTIKSQFANGYIYDALGNSAAVSKFWDPGYLTQSVGVGYQPVPEVKTRLGVGLREICASEFASLYTDDITTPDLEKTRVDGGLEEVTEVSWSLAENLLLSSKLELFAPFTTLDEIVTRGDNTLTAKVTKYVTVTFNVQFINERRITPRTQLKETLAMGLSYTLF